MEKFIKQQKTLNNKKKFTVTLNIKTPFILPQNIIHIGEISQKYNGVLKIGTNQKISIINIEEDNLQKIIDDLNFDCIPKGKNLLTNITICTSNFCRMSKYPTIGIYMKIVNEFYGIELPAKTKVGISSCKNSCVSAYVKDIGILVDTNGKFFITIGGSAGPDPKSGYTLAYNLDERDAYKIFKSIIKYYKSNANSKEKLRDFIDRIGFENFKSELSI